MNFNGGVTVSQPGPATHWIIHSRGIFFSVLLYVDGSTQCIIIENFVTRDAANGFHQKACKNIDATRGSGGFCTVLV
jgi:hypothetical protein